MPTTTSPDSIAKLRSAIDRADQMYYRQGKQSNITDAEYDGWKVALRHLDPTDPRLTRVGVPYSADELRSKTPHTMPMGSLDNTDGGIDGFAEWADKMSAACSAQKLPLSIMASLKYDGSSISANYVDGSLVSVITRGNGTVGEDVTANAVKWMGLPTALPVALTISVRGEAMLYKNDFNTVNQLSGTPDDEISNPRNVGNGMLSRTDGMYNEYIRFVAFNCVAEGSEKAKLEDIVSNSEYSVAWPATMNEQFKLLALNKLGFNVVDHKLIQSHQVISELRAWYDEVLATRDSLDFEIDGIVVVVNWGDVQDSFVKEPKDRMRPKFARAIKFPVKVNTTKVVDCIISIGHNGVLVPTAVLEEVRIGGVNVTNALLNNWSDSSENLSAADVAIGDEVEVGLAGDIIPKILSIVTSFGNPTIAEPTKCPFCGSPTTRELRGAEGAATYCTNAMACPGALRKKVDHWIGSSKKGAGILGIGDGVLDAMISSGLVADPADLYTLTAQQLENLPVGNGQLGSSRANKIVAEIDKKRVMTLEMFMGCLGIELLGRRRTEILRKEAGGKLDTLDQWLDADNLKDALGDGTIGLAVSEGIEAAKPLIAKLRANGCTVGAVPFVSKSIQRRVAEMTTSSKTVDLTGKSFCFTGTRDLIEEVQAAGGEIKSGVSKGLQFLVQKDATSQSNKTRKADEYGVQVISVDYLRKVLSGEKTL